MNKKMNKEELKTLLRVHLLGIGIKSDHEIETAVGYIDKAYKAGKKENPIYQEVFAEGESRGRRVERKKWQPVSFKRKSRYF